MEGNQIITVEAEYTIDGESESTVSQWTCQNRDPAEAKDFVIRYCVPQQATVWRVGLWFGTPDNRPDGGHKSGILTSTEDDLTHDNRNSSLDEFVD